MWRICHITELTEARWFPSKLPTMWITCGTAAVYKAKICIKTYIYTCNKYTLNLRFDITVHLRKRARLVLKEASADSTGSRQAPTT